MKYPSATKKGPGRYHKPGHKKGAAFGKRKGYRPM